MNIKHFLFTTTAIIALSSASFAADKETYESNTTITRHENGHFSEKNKSSKIHMDGTLNSFEKDLIITKDSQGNIEKTITTESISDAKGVGNKHVIKTKDTEKNKNGVLISSSHEASVDGQSVDSDNRSFAKDANGNYERKDTIVRTDANGTTRRTATDVRVNVDANGEATKTTITEKSVDPMGLGNKTNVKTIETKAQ